MTRGVPQDLTGRRFGRLTVIGPGPFTIEKYPRRMWHCRCDCGTERFVAATNLRQPAMMSCGCYRRERCQAMGRKNGSAPQHRRAANRLQDAMRGWGAA